MQSVPITTDIVSSNLNQVFDIHNDHVIMQIVFNTSPIQKENKRVVNAPPSCNGLGVKHYVIKFVNDLQQVNDFIRVFRFLHLFMRILNYQMSAINYVLLSNDICKGVKRVIIDKGGLFDIHNDSLVDGIFPY
jgi:hypothetical protein